VNHDAAALAVVKRFLDGEGATLEGAGNQPLAPTRVENGIKIFQLTIDKILHRIDAVTDPIAALGYNGTWPAPRIEVVEGDRIRAVFRNNLDESTGVHFHGQRVPNAMDGVPHITQDPIEPGASFAYEFEVRTPGSHMCTTRTTMRPTRSGGVCSGRSSSSRRTRRTGTTASTA
jgi:FtsP/CotA-like multicopper oxidase with cupredoxin domain